MSRSPSLSKSSMIEPPAVLIWSNPRRCRDVDEAADVNLGIKNLRRKTQCGRDATRRLTQGHRGQIRQPPHFEVRRIGLKVFQKKSHRPLGARLPPMGAPLG